MNSVGKRKRVVKIDPATLSPESKKKYLRSQRQRDWRSKAKLQQQMIIDKNVSMAESNAKMSRKLVALEKKVDELTQMLHDKENGDKDDDDDDDDDVEHEEELSSGDFLPDGDEFEPLPESASDVDASHLRLVMERATRNAQQFRMLTGYTLSVFESFATTMNDYILQTTLKGVEVKRVRAVDSTSTSPREQLFVTLVWQRLRVSFAILSFFFGLPLSYLQKITKRCAAALARAGPLVPKPRKPMPRSLPRPDTSTNNKDNEDSFDDDDEPIRVASTNKTKRRRVASE